MWWPPSLAATLHPRTHMKKPSESNPRIPSDTKVIPRGQVPQESDAIQDSGVVVATRNHELIRDWARRHAAEPATGEKTASGDAKLNIQDGGARIRFNFPAAASYRPISWDEWLDAFDRDHLVFLYEPADARATGAFGSHGGSYYRLLPASEWVGDLR